MKTSKNNLLTCIVLLLATAGCSQNQKRTVSIEPTRMNVLYIGVDNPLRIAVSDVESNKLEVSVDSFGEVSGSNGEYIVRPTKPGSIKVIVKIDGKEITRDTFRVKIVPDPVAKVAGQKGGQIELEKLINAGKVNADIENFDFDLPFNVVHYRVSYPLNGTVHELESKGNELKQEQIDFLKNLKKGQKVFFDEIDAAGPDGNPRRLGALIFSII